MKLYLLRHGIAVDADAWDGDDASRPLTSDGRKEMEREARAIAKLDLKLERIVTSPLKRARETAQIVAERLDLTDCLIEDDRLAGNFDAARLVLLLRDLGAKESIMLVGHEPDFSKTIVQLIGGGSVDVKKGGLARIDIEDARTPAGDLIWLIPPKVLMQ
jgi:phosphohistidine phosphatase